MHSSLDLSPEEFTQFAESAVDLITQHYQNLDQQAGFHPHTPTEVRAWFDEPLPLAGMDRENLLELVRSRVLAPATGNAGPNMYAYVMSGGNQVSTIADFLASTINQNVTKWHLAPSMTEIEKRVVKWGSEMLSYTPDAGGALVSGGSEANLAGLTVARNVFFRDLKIGQEGLFGQKPFTVYCSTETHNCTDKSLSLLGIGSNHLRKISTHPDFTLRLDLLEQQIQNDIEQGFRPFCIVGNAGTVNTGAIDDLKGIAAIAERYQLWFHVDGAYGGLAASLPSLRQHYAGLELADSIAIDFHKWLYQPFEVACILVRDWSHMRETYFKAADYLGGSLPQKTDRFEFNEHYFQLSRNAKAFKVWMSLKAYGFTRIQAMMEKDIALTRYLEQGILKRPELELKSQSHLAIACFRYRGQNLTEAQIDQLNQDMVPALEKDGRVFIMGTRLNGQFVLRACVINHRKTEQSIDYLLDVVSDVGAKLALEMKAK